MKPYRKPAAICAVDVDVERIRRRADVAAFVAAEKARIEGRVAAAGFHLRLGTMDDVPAIQRLQARCWPPAHPTLEEPSLLYRMLSFGFVPLVEGPDGIVACNVNESYDDADRTSYGVRVSVDPAAGGHNFGAEMASYSALLGMERGSRVRRGVIGLTNHRAAANTLNHVGFVARALLQDVPVPGARFDIALPLTPGGVVNNRVDLEKTAKFIDTHEPGHEYVLVPCADTAGIAALYRDTAFRVVAFLKPGAASAEPTYLAVPMRLPPAAG